MIFASDSLQINIFIYIVFMLIAMMLVVGPDHGSDDASGNYGEDGSAYYGIGIT